jgi:protocatechuate 3,4-dioxygenase beta subunit
MRVNRRQTLFGFGLATGAALSGRSAVAQTRTETVGRVPLGAGMCVLTPQAVEGPYYFDPELERSDITESHQGVPLGLLLQVVEPDDCSPLVDARVDVWHANALGHYSGYQGQGDERDVSTVDQTFLRGTQFTDRDGQVSFTTIYPGWYVGRTPHIHFKIFVDDRNVVTGQIYFPDALSEFIYTNAAPYRDRKRQRDTTNDRDGVLQATGGRETFCAIKEEADRYLAALIVGVNRDAEASAASPPGGRPPPSGPPPGAADPAAPPRGGRGSLIPGAGG